MRAISISVAAALWFFATSIGNPSASVVYDFSFTNYWNNAGVPEVDNITGTITLPVATGTTSAISFQVTANSGGFGVGAYGTSPPAAQSNTFTFTNGILTYFHFNSFSGAGGCCSIDLLYDPANGKSEAGLIPFPDQSIRSSRANLTGTWPTDVIVTPLPGALPLFVTGLGVLGLLGCRRKRPMRLAA